MTETSSEKEKKELRKMQKLFLEDEGVKEIYAASMIHADQNYGNYAKQLAQHSYVDALKSDSPQVDRVISKAVKGQLQSNAEEVLKQGGDIYKNPALLDYGLIGEEAIKSYEIAMNSVYVKDILDNLGVKVSSKSASIKPDMKNKTMSELKEINSEIYDSLYQIYSQHIIQTSLANTMLNNDKNSIGGLEKMLNITEDDVQKQKELDKRINDLREKASKED